METKLQKLRDLLQELQSVAVAFSGGADSSLLLKVALDALGREYVLAVTSRSPSVPRRDLEAARALAEDIGAEHIFVDTDEFENDDYTSNPVNRCYFCKTTLYRHIAPIMTARGIAAMVNGTNADDLGDYRPGLAAAREHGVYTPLADAGLTKAEVRELSRRLGLPTSDKPASPCLSSRVPYGEAVTPEKLRMIEAAEAFLHSLGVRECRVRHYEAGSRATRKPGNQEKSLHAARVEVAAEFLPQITAAEAAARVRQHLESLGYHEVTIDPRGFRSGSLNDAIQLKVAASRS